MRGVKVIMPTDVCRHCRGIEVERGKVLLLDHPKLGFLETGSFDGDYHSFSLMGIYEISEMYISREDMIKCLEKTMFNDIVEEFCTSLVKKSFAWSTLICHWPNKRKIIEMCIEENMKNENLHLHSSQFYSCEYPKGRGHPMDESYPKGRGHPMDESYPRDPKGGLRRRRSPLKTHRPWKLEI